MSSKTLEIIQGLAAAAACVYDGSHDDILTMEKHIK